MAKTVRVVNRKRSSHKKNRAAIGKKSKVARRNRMSRRRNRVKRGGAIWIEQLQRNNLMMVWNSLFYERAKTKEDFKTKFVKTTEYRQASNDQSNLPSKVLFVIDMQKDFVDINYQRSGGDVHPVTGKDFSFGNFDVADGAMMLIKKRQLGGGEPNYMRPTQSSRLRLAATAKEFNLPEKQPVDENQYVDQTSVPKTQDVPEISVPDDKTDFLNYVEAAIKNENYAKVVFTRDYHPVGHSSFSGYFSESPILLCGDCIQAPTNYSDEYTGNFPAHCVQGFEGTKFVPEIENMITQNSTNEKIKILFKGMHKNIDSFTAVGKDVIDTISSNKTHKICKSCSSITGGYKLCSENGKEEPISTSVDFNVKVKKNDACMTMTNEEMNKTQLTTAEIMLDDDEHKFIKEEYDWLDDQNITTIEVCGLAGDYCVRDTVVALSQKYSDKKIVLLNDFTRYPALPFSSIHLLPQHKPESKYGMKGYDFAKSMASLEDEEIQKFMSKLSDQDKLDKNVVFDKYAKSDTEDKDIIYYLLEKNLETGERTLIDKQNLEKVNTNAVTTQHFITPLESFIEDYNKDNIQIVMSWIDKQST